MTRTLARHARSSSRLRSSRARGSAMLEMVLVMPVLLVILSLMILFGRQMVRLQRSAMMMRYEAFREVSYVQDTNFPRPSDAMSHISLNDAFFAGHAASIGHNQAASPVECPSTAGLVDAASAVSTPAGNLAQAALEPLPKRHITRLTVNHTTGLPLWQPFMRTIHRSNTQADHSWRMANGLSLNAGNAKQAWPAHGDWYYAGPRAAPMMAAIRQEFLGTLDQKLGVMIDQGNTLANATAAACWAEPSYRGPNTDLP